MRRFVIIGGGISGLAAAYELEYQLRGPSERASEIVLIEESPELGGKLRSERIDGFTLDWGPDGFLSRKRGALAICDELGLTPRLIGRRRAQSGSMIRRNGRLFPLPEGFSGLVPANLDALRTTPLLTPEGRARALAEPDVPPRAQARDDDESIAEFMSRRFGREAFERLIEPLVSGIFAGNADTLSLAATYPALRQTELRRGSLTGGLGAPADGAERSANPALPAMVSLREGMGSLADALASSLMRTRVELRSKAKAVQPGGASLLLEDGRQLPADAVIIAAPAHAAAGLVAGLDPPLSSLLAEVSFVSTTIVQLAFAPGVAPAVPTGYGYVVPAVEESPFRACTVSSAKWEGRAPEGSLLVRLHLRDGAASDENRLIELSRAELRTTLGITEPPILAKVHEWRSAMPQYTIGHLRRIDAITRRLDVLAEGGCRLQLAGASYRGVGIPDCIESGREAARRVVALSAASAVGVDGRRQGGDR